MYSVPIYLNAEINVLLAYKPIPTIESAGSHLPMAFLIDYPIPDCYTVGENTVTAHEAMPRAMYRKGIFLTKEFHWYLLQKC